MQKVNDYIKIIFSFLEKNSLFISITLTIILFTLFFPLFIGTNDEHCYIRNAHNLTRGGIIYEDYAQGLKSVDYGNGYTTKCMLGVSFLLIPATLIGWQFVFVEVLLFFILSVIVFHKILQKLNISTVFTFFYAFFPAFVYIQRTAFTETFTVTFTLLGIYFFIREKSLKSTLLSGLFFGISIFIRYTQVIFVFFWGLCLLIELISVLKNRRQMPVFEIKRVIAFVIPMLPFIPIILIINNALWGGPFKNGYDFNESDYEEALSLSVFPFMFIRYFIVLNLIFPFMWIKSFFANNRFRLLMIISSNALIFFYCLYKLYVWETRPLDAILGIRYLLPILPVIIILYASSFQRLFKTRFELISKVYLLLIILFSILTGVFIHYKHQNDFLKPRKDVLDEIVNFVPEGSVIIGQLDDFIYIMEPYNNQLYEDAYNIERIEDSRSKLILEKDVYLVIIKDPNKGRSYVEIEKLLREYKDQIVRINIDTKASNLVEIYRID